jgi:hypothetical protein
MLKLVLLGTAGCHLCDVAANVVAQAMDVFYGEFLLVETDIVESEVLVERYATRIPVLQISDVENMGNLELGWPFSVQQVVDFLAPCLVKD